MYKIKNLKGLSLGDLQGIALTLVVIAIIAGVGVLINGNLETGVRSTSLEASQAINNSTAGISNLTQRLPLIGTIAGFVVLLAYVIGLLVKTTG